MGGWGRPGEAGTSAGEARQARSAPLGKPKPRRLAAAHGSVVLSLLAVLLLVNLVLQVRSGAVLHSKGCAREREAVSRGMRKRKRGGVPEECAGRLSDCSACGNRLRAPCVRPPACLRLNAAAACPQRQLTTPKPWQRATTTRQQGKARQPHG